MDERYAWLARAAARNHEELAEPHRYDLTRHADRAALESLVRAGGVTTHDTVEAQLAELCETRDASRRWTPADLAAAVAAHAGVSLAEYGLWVHYPWSRRIVHVLPEAEYRRACVRAEEPQQDHARLEAGAARARS